MTVVVSYLALCAALIGLGLLVVHVAAPVRHWDDHVNSWFATHRSAAWNAISKGGTFVANTLGVLAVAVVVTVIAVLQRWGRAAALLLTGLALELATFLTVNYVVQRPRPSAPHLGPTPSTYSFPSGHVAATLVLYGGIAVLVASRTRLPLARIVAWVIAALAVGWVGFSRVYEAQHHPTDVFAGFILGVVALVAAVAAIRPVPASPERATPSGTARSSVEGTREVVR